MSSRAHGGSLSSVAAERVDAALEASCEALVALQLVRGLASDESLKLHTTRAIELVRRSIKELRAARGEPPSPFAYGFVLGRQARPSPEPEPDPEPRPGQSKPRRTA